MNSKPKTEGRSPWWWLWGLALVAVLAAIVIQQVRTHDEGIQVELIVLLLIVIAIPTPAVAGLLDRLQEFSFGGASLKLAPAAESVAERLLPTPTDAEEEGEKGDAGHFIEKIDEDRSAAQLLQLQENLEERLKWIDEHLDLPAVIDRGPGTKVDQLERKIDQLLSVRLLFPDEAAVLKSLVTIKPSEAEKEQRKDRHGLATFVRTSDRLAWQLRGRVFDRQARGVFEGPELGRVWRILSWRPQPGGRWTPWFIAHVDGIWKAELRSLLIAARSAPTDGGLRKAIEFLENYRTEMPAGEQLKGFVVLRDGSPQLKKRDEFKRDDISVISLTELRGIAAAPMPPVKANNA